MGVRSSLTIREMPVGERPREKMLLLGARQLTNRELIAILLGSGTRDASALTVADWLLSEFQNLGNLADASVEELQGIPGIGEAKAIRLAAACELGRRLVHSPPVRPEVRSARDVVEHVQGVMGHLDREEFRVLLLDTKHRLLELHKVSVGHLNGTLVHPREVFKQAIRRSSDAVILVHNHPSGDPTPSPEDIAVTRRLVAAGRIIGIEVLDHVILGAGSYVSLRQEGYITDEGVASLEIRI